MHESAPLTSSSLRSSGEITERVEEVDILRKVELGEMDEILDVDGEVFSICQQRVSAEKTLWLYATHAVCAVGNLPSGFR